MTAATGVRREVQDYLAAVEHELADLTAEDRSALMEDLALHLDALAAEDDDRPLVVRLGPAAAYAADLRAAAGLPARGGVTPASSVRSRLDAALGSAVYRRAEPVLRSAGRLLVDLRPAWWVLRGYLLVLVPCLLGGDYVHDIPVPAPMRSHLLGVLLVLAAVTGSVVLGRRRLPKVLGAIVVAAGVLLVLAAAAVAQDVRDDVAGRVNAAALAPPSDGPSEVYPLFSRHGPVTDVFPYAADGTPLTGVLLYDQDGRPLHVGFQQWWADQCVRELDQPKAADGVAVPNSFPQAYELTNGGVNVFGDRVASGVCVKDLPRPDVPLPTFAASASAAPAPGD